MDLAKSQMQRERPPPEPESFTMADSKDPTDGWRRMVLRLFWVLQEAQASMVVQGFSSTEIRSFSKKSKEMRVLRQVLWEQVVSRKPLLPGRFKPTATAAADCTHEHLAQRANAYTAWWTCKSCATRFPRAPDETLDLASVPKS